MAKNEENKFICPYEIRTFRTISYGFFSFLAISHHFKHSMASACVLMYSIFLKIFINNIQSRQIVSIDTTKITNSYTYHLHVVKCVMRETVI